jgi:hypothetical protein
MRNSKHRTLRIDYWCLEILWTLELGFGALAARFPLQFINQRSRFIGHSE